MSKIDISFWVTFVLYHGPGVDGFAGCTGRLQIGVACLVKIHHIMLFGRRRLSFVGWYKVKHLANSDLKQKPIRRLIGQASQ